MLQFLARVVLLVFYLWMPGGMLLLQATSPGPHIAEVNILLPPKMTHPVDYRLSASDGCFKWTWDHHDILAVIPEYNSTSHCSTSARIRSIAAYSGRKETALYATDVNTGIVIRCKVFIDSISRIKISHNSVKLDLDGLATLRVRAFDDQDNEFSSLVGLKFMWQLSNSNGSPHCLVHVPLKDSPLSDCGGLCGDLNIQVKLEGSGVFSDMFVVKGVGIGEERVSVNLLETDFEDVADTISLTVAEAMSLDPPSPVFVIIGSSLQYSLKVIRRNFPQAVSLPSAHHRWFVKNSSVAEVNSALGLAYSLNIGATSIFVEDTRVSGNILESAFIVVLPQYITFYFVPLKDYNNLFDTMHASSSAGCWYLITGHEYLIQIKVFSHGAEPHEIYINESDELLIDDTNTEHLKLYLPSNDLAPNHGRWDSRVLSAVSQGKGRIKASLKYLNGKDERKKVIRAEQELRICDPVKLLIERSGENSTIFLPWAPSIFQKATLKATGGCGTTSNDYEWIVSDSSIVNVPTYGVLTALKPGKTTLKVVSIFDSLNFDEVLIDVTVPSLMTMLPNLPVESVTQAHLNFAAIMTAPNGKHFYICDAFHPFVKWMTLDNEAFKIVNSTVNSESAARGLSTLGPACSWSHLYVSNPGHTILQATLSKEYYNNDHVLVPITLKASITIAGYLPLSVHQVGNGNRFGGYTVSFVHEETFTPTEKLDELFLVPGSTMDVMIFGGPQPWGRGVEFFESVEVLNEQQCLVLNEAAAYPIRGSQNMYRVSCFGEGFFHVMFKRGNMIGDDHPLPAIANATVNLACRYPSSVALLIDESDNTKELIHRAAHAGYNDAHKKGAPVAIANGRIIRIAAVGIDSSGKIFSNSSSLHLNWELGSCNGLATWDNSHISTLAASTWERRLVLFNESGECIVRVSASASTHTFNSIYSEFVRSEYSLTGAAHFRLVTLLSLYPSFSLLFYNPEAKASLSIFGGTCFLDASVNNSQVIEVSHPPSNFPCSEIVVSPTGLGTANLTVLDVGLTPPVAVSSVVQVSDIDWIKILSEDEIVLMEGESASLEIVAGTNGGFIFDSSQYNYMKFHVHIDDDILDVENKYKISSSHSLDSETPKVRLTAKHIGITTVYITVRQHSGLQVTSQIVKVEVFAALKIIPDNIFLAPGATYMLAVKGGPTTGSHVQYVSLHEDIAAVDAEFGKMFAISPGKTKILARVYQNDREVICESLMTITVGIPSSAELTVQSEQIDIGRLMPIYPRFIEGNLFSFYQLCKKYDWTVENDEVISFHNDLERPTQEKLINNEMDLEFYKILYGRSAGRTQISVSFSCDFVSTTFSQTRVYTSSLLLSTVATLPISLGSPVTWILPPHYTSSPLLPSTVVSPTDRDGKNHKQTITYSLLQTCSKNVQQVDSISISDEMIKTSESGELACIQGKDRASGRVEIASCVRVAEVYQIRITNKFSTKRIFLAVGAQLHLPIHFFDALGNRFHEAHSAAHFAAETNYHDVVEIDHNRNSSGSLHLKGKKHGEALIRVEMNRNPDKSDYILVSVGAHLYPQNPVLRLGGLLHFSVQGSNNLLNGRWLSSNESVVSIQQSSGHAEAVGVGTTQVIHDGPAVRLQTSVTVLSGSVLSVDAPNEIVTNVGDSSDGYKFFVKLSDFDGLENMAKDKGLPFSCKVEPEFVGYSKPWKDLKTGNFYCLFFPHSPEHLAHSVSKTKNMRPYLSISITASLKSSNISSTISSLFVAGFSIMETIQGIKKVNLTSHSDVASITILGNTDVTVHFNERHSLDVRLIERDNYGVGGVARYQIKVLDDEIYPFKDTISISIPATGQKHEIHVNFVPAAASEPRLASTVWFPIFIMMGIFVLVIVALMIIFEVSNRSHRHRQSRRPPSTPPLTIPLTPERGSSARSGSPATPQPFIDYVRKTIDETPNYRRGDARRRFNVQNTL